eukprot:m.8967 g.8967  ORF g.8967 m.8967 type:complete len:786 (+) comp5411_c0_seq1:292-2649(+)
MMSGTLKFHAAKGRGITARSQSQKSKVWAAHKAVVFQDDDVVSSSSSSVMQQPPQPRSPTFRSRKSRRTKRKTHTKGASTAAPSISPRKTTALLPHALIHGIRDTVSSTETKLDKAPPLTSQSTSTAANLQEATVTNRLHGRSIPATSFMRLVESSSSDDEELPPTRLTRVTPANLVRSTSVTTPTPPQTSPSAQVDAVMDTAPDCTEPLSVHCSLEATSTLLGDSKSTKLVCETTSPARSDNNSTHHPDSLGAVADTFEDPVADALASAVAETDAVADTVVTTNADTSVVAEQDVNLPEAHKQLVKGTDRVPWEERVVEFSREKKTGLCAESPEKDKQTVTAVDTTPSLFSPQSARAHRRAAKVRMQSLDNIQITDVTPECMQDNTKSTAASSTTTTTSSSSSVTSSHPLQCTADYALPYASPITKVVLRSIRQKDCIAFFHKERFSFNVRHKANVNCFQGTLQDQSRIADMLVLDDNAVLLTVEKGPIWSSYIAVFDDPKSSPATEPRWINVGEHIVHQLQDSRPHHVVLGDGRICTLSHSRVSGELQGLVWTSHDNWRTISTTVELEPRICSNPCHSVIEVENGGDQTFVAASAGFCIFIWGVDDGTALSRLLLRPSSYFVETNSEIPLEFDAQLVSANFQAQQLQLILNLQSGMFFTTTAADSAAHPIVRLMYRADTQQITQRTKWEEQVPKVFVHLDMDPLSQLPLFTHMIPGGMLLRGVSDGGVFFIDEQLRCRTSFAVRFGSWRLVAGAVDGSRVAFAANERSGSNSLIVVCSVTSTV